MIGLTRRDALRLAGGLGAAGGLALLASCTKPAAPPPTGPSPTALRPSATPSTPDWTRLAGQLTGALNRPGDAGYAAAARLYNPRFDAAARPTAVVGAASAADVATGLRFAADTQLPFALRSGGHSYPGWSTSSGLVIDVSAMNTVTVDTANQVARIGAGARLADVYAALAAKGVGIAAGSCPTVGIAGLTLGGGVGVLSRAWGLTCDALRSAQIVTADGTTREVDATHDPDLFWALRGGGGGSFGAVTAFTLAVRPVPTVSTFYLDWGFGAAAEVIDAWQSWIRTADRRITSSCKLLTDPRVSGRTPLIGGTWIGPEADLSGQLAPLLAKLPAPATRSLHAHAYADAMLLEAGCSGQNASACLAGALSATKRQAFAATSSIVDTAIPGAAITAAIAQATAALNVPGLYEGGVSFDGLGGAVADLGPDATAFGHRTALATVQYTATWTDNSLAPTRFDAYVRGFRTAMTPWFGTGAYVNYADAGITDYASAYWGANYPRLQQVKNTYDAHGLFTFPQSVRTAA